MALISYIGNGAKLKGDHFDCVIRNEPLFESPVERFLRHFPSGYVDLAAKEALASVTKEIDYHNWENLYHICIKGCHTQWQINGYLNREGAWA